MKKDPALSCSNPRLIAAIYFGLLSVVGTVLINAFLTLLGIQELVPLFAAVLIGMLVSSCTGAIMGKKLLHCPKPYKLKSFLIGFFMVLFSLPFFCFGLMLAMEENPYLFNLFQTHSLFYAYLYILGYSYLLFGFALAFGSGLAALYLRSQLVYDILATYQPKEPIKKMPDSPIEKNKIEHSDRVSLNIQEQAPRIHVRPK